MSISAAAQALSSFTSPASSLSNRQAKPKAAATGIDPQAITTQFQQKNELQQLRAEFLEKVLKERNVGDKDLAHLSDNARVVLKREVDQRLHSSLQAKGGSDGPPPAQVLDIKV